MESKTKEYLPSKIDMPWMELELNKIAMPTTAQ